MPEPSDAELIRLSVEDPSRFEVVFERHYDTVRRYAQRRIGDAAGEEVAARTFLLAFERRARFRPNPSGSARPWLLGIATNVLRHHVRDERTHLRILSAMPAEEDAVPPDDDATLHAIGVRPALAEALGSLPRVERETFLLLVLGELSYDELAEALDVPSGTVRSRIHRARARLRERSRGLEASTDDAPPEEPSRG